MIVDLGQMTDPRDLDSEVVIIGAGAAGITLAAALSAQDISVTILEAGGVDPSSYDVGFFDGDVVGLPYDLLTSRQRSLGGATNRWSGWSRPIDDFVFQRREWVGDARWPFGASELSQWFKRAHTFMGLGAYEWSTASLQRKQRRPGVGDARLSEVLTAPLWRFMSDPLAFQVRYADVLERGNVKVVVNAPVEDFMIRRGRAVAATVVAPSSTRVSVGGDHFFLAAGDIENVRLLLHIQNAHRSEGLDLDRSGWLGQGWMEHPHIQTGVLVSPQSALDSALYFQSDFRYDDGIRVIAGVGVAPDVLAREQMPNISFSLFQRKDDSEQDGVKHLSAVTDAVRGLSGSDTSVRSVFARSESRIVKRSYIALSKRTDRFGIPLARLNWQVASRDVSDLYRSQRILAEEFGRLGIGVIAEDRRPFADRVTGGNHHIGGARMAQGPAKGVTDEYGRLFGLAGVSVTGSALFPTGGFSNPTMTILALALRQADHYVQEGRR